MSQLLNSSKASAGAGRACGRRWCGAGGDLVRCAGRRRVRPDPDPGAEGSRGALADCTPMTNFRAERQFGTFSAADAW